MRWRIQLSYLGTNYAGWQRQPGAMSVQQRLEEAFSTILRQPVELVGCGRTDAGVHARDYVAHMDAEAAWDPDRILYQVNAILPPDIAIRSIRPAAAGFHARYDATSRCYRYYLHVIRDPLSEGRSLYYPQPDRLDHAKMEAVAALLPLYDHFAPFCKTGSDARHFQCRVTVSAWSFREGGAVYTICANRFLRGMVRLVVGACLNAGTGKITVEDVRGALDNQTPVPHAWSVPPEGLFLETITYPD